MFKWFQIKCVLVGAVMFCLGGNLAHADIKDNEILPLFPLVTLVPSSDLTKGELQLFTRKFGNALATSFLDLGIKLYDRADATELSLSGHKEKNGIKSPSFLQLQLELLAEKNGEYIPYIKAVNLSSGELLGMATTMPVALKSSQVKLTAASISLSRSLTRKLADKGHRLGGYSSLYLAKTPQSVRISIEKFDSCEQNHILDILEKEFPGFVSLELEKSPTPTISIFNYQTTATSQKIQKWLRVLLFEYGLASEDDFMIIGKADNLRLVARNKTAFLSDCF